MYISNVIRSRSVQILGASVGSFVAGYFVARRTVKRMEMDDIRRSIEEYNGGLPHSLQDLNYVVENEEVDASVEIHPSQTTVSRRIIEVPTENRTPVDYTTMFKGDGDVPALKLVSAPPHPENPGVVNVFTNPDNDWNEEAEYATRSDTAPYVITVDEYTADEFGNKQETVTFYELDEVMVDPYDNIIEKWPELMGPLKWGHGSRSATTVYIRNEKLRREWEVCCELNKSYAQEVQGLEADDEAEKELRHHRPLRFKDD